LPSIRWNKVELLLVTLGLPVIAGFSLYYFQAVNSPLLDSDQAVWVHLARDPHFPDALYFYGQNRLGSLLPLTAHLLVLLGVPAIWAVSLVNLMVQCGAAALSFRLSKSAAASLIVALVLMFPPWTMYTISLIGHPYTTQIFLWFLILSYLSDRKELSNKSAFVLSLLSLLSLWVSSLSILFVPVLAFAIWFHFKQRNRGFWLRLSASFLIGLSMIIFVKSKLRGSGSSFINIASPEGIKANFEGFLEIILYYWHQNIGIQILILFLLAILFFQWIFGRSTLSTRLTFAYGLLALIFTHLSKWVTVNDSGIRYWALPVALLIFSAIMKKGRMVKLTSIPLLAAILWAGIDSTKFLDSGYRHVPGRPSRSEMEFIAQKIDGNVMADYWSLYLLKIFNYDLNVSNPEPWLARDHWNWETVASADTIWSVNIETEPIWVMNGDTLMATPAPVIFVGESAARQYYRP
jgi:hypothetical protein